VSDNKQADAKMVADGLAFEIYRRVCECLCVHLSELSFSSIAQQLTGSCSDNEYNLKEVWRSVLALMSCRWLWITSVVLGLCSLEYY
jgi:hypothetical protein